MEGVLNLQLVVAHWVMFIFTSDYHVSNASALAAKTLLFPRQTCFSWKSLVQKDFLVEHFAISQHDTTIGSV